MISKIPRITNYAEPCYVRVKPVFDEEETQDYRLGEEDLGGIEDVWLKAGEYYYYPKCWESRNLSIFPYNHHSICVDQ